MNAPSQSGRDRQRREVLVVGLCLIALGVLAVALAASGGTLADESPAAIQPAEQVSGQDRPGLVGGGSLGAAERNPLGAGVPNETNPFESRSDERQFTVETSQPTYWRVDAYDTYENGTWVRTGDYENYEPPIQPTGPVDGTQTVSITTEQDAAVLPTPWQPETLSDLDEASLAVSSQIGIHPASVYPTERQYTVRSLAYEPDPHALLVSRGNYPESIEQQYTTLPEGVDERIPALGEEITDGTVTPVQAVCTIDDWIATNKTYDPTATHDAEQEPLEQYLFEMDSGNAEYAAASLVVLARSQGIPARYVTGYTPGEQSDDGVVVRAVNAHAWAEVYVTGHGWIPFDPTPRDDRLAVEQQAAGDGEMIGGSLPADCRLDVDLDETFNDQPDDTVETSTDETDTDESSSDDETPDGFEELPSAPAGTNVTIRTDPDPMVSGGTTTATVLIDGEPLSGGTVSIDGASVGSTDDNGEIEFRVPSTESGLTALIVRTDDLEVGQLVDVVTFELTAEPEQLIGLPGETVTVTATAGDRPVSELPLRDDDGVVGTTDGDGQATVPVSVFPWTTVEATYRGATATTQIENQLLGVVLRLVGVAGIVGVVGVVLTREYNLRAIARRRTIHAWQWATHLSRLLSARLSGLPTALYARHKRGGWNLLGTVRRLPSVLVRALRQRLPDSILAYLVALAIKLYRIFARGELPSDSSPSTASASTESVSLDPPTADESDDDTATNSRIKSVWYTFVRLVVRRISPTQTPGEIARTAIETGFPREPVVRLTAAFRTAVYGPTRSEGLVDEAERAFETLSVETDSEPTAEGTREHSHTAEDSR